MNESRSAKYIVKSVPPPPHNTDEEDRDDEDDGDDDQDHDDDQDPPKTLKTSTSPRKGGTNGDCVCNTKLNTAA